MGSVQLMRSLTRDPGLADRLLPYLAERELLVVIDNLEQLPGAADLVGDLVRGARASRFVATSRTPLRLSGEQEYPLAPLPLPDAAAEVSQPPLGRVEPLVLEDLREDSQICPHSPYRDPHIVYGLDRVRFVLLCGRRFLGPRFPERWFRERPARARRSGDDGARVDQAE